jgi:uncharacterized membrane protein HdeD (DUF308 family)
MILMMQSFGKKRGESMQGWTGYLGPMILVVAGVLLYSVDIDVPTAGTLVLALPLVLAGLVWSALEIRRRITAPESTGERGKARGEDY